MRLCLLFLALTAITSRVQAGRDVRFPYEAVIEAEETYVRSGAGSKYYPTGRLRRGDKVVVHRHDPGGWFMIAPPPGSFSWVPAKYVERSAPDRGTVKTNNVAARVGSFESDIRDVFQRPLARGDDVRIVGEKMLAPEAGAGPAELWYRIEPPRGEWRWVAGQAVAPPLRAEDQVSTGDPFDASPDTKRPPASSLPLPRIGAESSKIADQATDTSQRDYLDDSAERRNREPLGSRPLVRKANKPALANQAARRQDAILDELDRLDARFRSILIRPVLEWDFGQLDHDYQNLREETDSANIQQMIDARLARIADSRKTRTAEEDLARLQEETTRRDAELAEIQHRQEANLASLSRPRFDGAGIVQRAALNRRGAPQYVLVAPTGRVLAYLVPAPGVNLESWVGRAAGVIGSRLPHPELKSDLITVNRLTPVRLAP
jgi:uncharacterized protein YgiM (DUF1202 family)